MAQPDAMDVSDDGYETDDTIIVGDGDDVRVLLRLHRRRAELPTRIQIDFRSDIHSHLAHIRNTV
jgi:hypothetical protein